MSRFLRIAMLAVLVCLMTAGCDRDISDAARFERRYRAQLDALQALCADSIRYLAVSQAWDNWQTAHGAMFAGQKIVAASVRGVGAPASATDRPALFEVKSSFLVALSFAGDARPAEGTSVVETGTLKFREKIRPVFRYRRTVRGWNGGLYEIELTAER